jgi:hypothetical protein
MDQRRNMAARRRGLWAAAIVTTAPSPPSNPSDTFATKSDPFAEMIAASADVLEQFACYCNRACAQDNAPLMGYTGAGRTTRSSK